MSTTHHLGRTAAAPPPHRVRDQARAVAALITFSAATASVLSLGLLLVLRLVQAGQG